MTQIKAGSRSRLNIYAWSDWLARLESEGGGAISRRPGAFVLALASLLPVASPAEEDIRPDLLTEEVSRDAANALLWHYAAVLVVLVGLVLIASSLLMAHRKAR